MRGGHARVASGMKTYEYETGGRETGFLFRLATNLCTVSQKVCNTLISTSQTSILGNIRNRPAGYNNDGQIPPLHLQTLTHGAARV